MVAHLKVDIPLIPSRSLLTLYLLPRMLFCPVHLPSCQGQSPKFSLPYNTSNGMNFALLLCLHYHSPDANSLRKQNVSYSLFMISHSTIAILVEVNKINPATPVLLLLQLFFIYINRTCATKYFKCNS